MISFAFHVYSDMAWFKLATDLYHSKHILKYFTKKSRSKQEIPLTWLSKDLITLFTQLLQQYLQNKLCPLNIKDGL